MRNFLYRRALWTVACLVANVAASSAQSVKPSISAPVTANFQRLLAAPAVKAALAAIEADDERTLREPIELAEIPAPPLTVAVRAAESGKRLGPQNKLLAMLGLVGMDGVSAPLLPKRPR